MKRSLWRRMVAPIDGMHAAAYVLGALTLLSQILALLRDHLFAHTFGSGPVLDIYYAAFKVPDLIFALVSSLVSAYILIPYIANISRKETGRILSESFSFLLISAGGICVVLGFFAPSILRGLYPVLMASPHHAAFVLLMRILLIQPILLGVSGILGSVTQIERQFFLYALAPALYNLGIIFGTLVLYPVWGITGIGYGVLLGALLYVATNIPAVVRSHVHIRFTLPEKSVLLPIIRESIPRSLAMGMDSLTLLFLTALAARLSSGSVSVFTLASNLENVPLALIGGSYAVAAFPILSKHAFANSTKFIDTLSSSARHILVWSTIALAVVFTLRVPIVRVILGTGAFTPSAVRITAALLALLVVGLAAQGLALLFSRALYARRQSWYPLAYQFGSAAVTALIALALISHASRTAVLAWIGHALHLGSLSGVSVLALAFAATVGKILLALSLLFGLRSVAVGLAQKLARPFLQSLVSAVLSGIVGYRVLQFFNGATPHSSLSAALIDGSIVGAAVLATAVATLWALRNEELLEIFVSINTFLQRRFPSGKVTLPSDVA